MARGKLFLILVLLLHSCAEVIPLTGGERDVYAPKPVNGTQNPQQGAIGFNGNELVVTFDEYFTLTDPNKTIEMNPSCGTITAEQKNKTLRIKWSEELLKNTTYTLTLDGSVLDLSEKNDTIHQFVFSTGLSIDTAQISGKCVEAFSNSLLGNTTIYLFEEGKNFKTDKPKFKTRSNKFGGFTFSYLPANTIYSAFAFNDLNKNSSWDANEKSAFYTEINSSDSLLPTLYFYQEERKELKLSVVVVEPGMAILTGKEVGKTLVNGVKPQFFKSYNSDSALVFLPLTSQNYQFVLENDTVVKSAKSSAKNLSIKSSSSKVRSGDTLRFISPDLIQQFDPSKITLTKGAEQILQDFKQEQNGFSFVVPNNWTGDFKLTLKEQALEGVHAKSDSTQIGFSVLGDNELAALTLKLENFESDVLIELVENNFVVYSKLKKSIDQIVKFEHLIPGSYTIRCVEDKNSDGRWTNGSLDKKQQPELVYYFKLTQKLRPNWEVEQTLERK